MPRVCVFVSLVAKYLRDKFRPHLICLKTSSCCGFRIMDFVKKFLSPATIDKVGWIREILIGRADRRKWKNKFFICRLLSWSLGAKCCSVPSRRPQFFDANYASEMAAQRCWAHQGFPLPFSRISTKCQCTCPWVGGWYLQHQFLSPWP